MDYDTAVDLTYKTFRARHPGSRLPAWFDECVVLDGSRDALGCWTIEVVLVPKPAPQPALRPPPNARRVTAIDARSAQTVAVADAAPQRCAPFVVFRVAIGGDGDIAVLADHDVSGLDGDAYQRGIDIELG